MKFLPIFSDCTPQNIKQSGRGRETATDGKQTEHVKTSATRQELILVYLETLLPPGECATSSPRGVAPSPLQLSKLFLTIYARQGENQDAIVDSAQQSYRRKLSCNPDPKQKNTGEFSPRVSTKSMQRGGPPFISQQQKEACGKMKISRRGECSTEQLTSDGLTGCCMSSTARMTVGAGRRFWVTPSAAIFSCPLRVRVLMRIRTAIATRMHRPITHSDVQVESYKMTCCSGH